MEQSPSPGRCISNKQACKELVHPAGTFIGGSRYIYLYYPGNKRYDTYGPQKSQNLRVSRNESIFGIPGMEVWCNTVWEERSMMLMDASLTTKKQTNPTLWGQTLKPHVHRNS